MNIADKYSFSPIRANTQIHLPHTFLLSYKYRLLPLSAVYDDVMVHTNAMRLTRCPPHPDRHRYNMWKTTVPPFQPKDPVHEKRLLQPVRRRDDLYTVAKRRSETYISIPTTADGQTPPGWARRRQPTIYSNASVPISAYCAAHAYGILFSRRHV